MDHFIAQALMILWMILVCRFAPPPEKQPPAFDKEVIIQEILSVCDKVILRQYGFAQFGRKWGGCHDVLRNRQDTALNVRGDGHALRVRYGAYPSMQIIRT